MNSPEFTAQELDSATKMIIDAWGFFTPKTPAVFEEWAEENIVLAQGEAMPGPYNISRTEPVRGIMRAFTDPTVNYIYIMSATQMFKTTILLAILLYRIMEQPCNMLFAMPTKALLRPFVRGRLEALCKQSATFAHLISNLKHQESIGGRQTQDVKYFPGGHLRFTSADAIGGLTGTPSELTMLDEIDKFSDHNAIDEAMSRGKNFPFFKLVACSSPETRDKSKIADLYDTSNKSQYWHKCPQCGQESLPVWDHVKYDLMEGAVITDSVGILCPLCEYFMNDVARNVAISKGRWVASRPQIKDAYGFHINSLSSQMIPLSRIVNKYVVAKKKEAMGELSPLRRFMKDDMAIPWGDGSGDLDEFKVRTELRLESWDYHSLPNEILTLTAAVDVQSDRFEFEIAGWGLKGKRWGLKYMRLVAPPSETKSWDSLYDILAEYRVMTREDGVRLECSTTFVDSGGLYTNECYKFTFSRGDNCLDDPALAIGLFPIKGKGGDRHPIIHTAKWSDELMNRLIIIGVDQAKGYVIDIINYSIENGRGIWLWNSSVEAGYDEAYFISLCAERRTLVLVDGKRKTKYKLRRSKLPNEGFDIAVYNYAALCMRAGNSQQVENYLKSIADEFDNV